MSGVAIAVRQPIHRALAALAIGAAVVVHLVLQAGMVLSVPGWTAGTFRNFYASDQLSYLSIVVDGAHGDFRSVEPFTETGSIYYPHAYYLLLGGLARLTGIDSVTLWTIGGLAVQCVLVAMIGLACVLLTRRAAAGVLGFVPFIIGTLSTVRGDGWFTQLASHAVLWGAFAPLFTLNGESVALAIGASALLVLVLVTSGWLRGTKGFVACLLACGAIGLLAGVQTYAFLAATYVLAYAVAAWGLYRTRRTWLVGATGALVVALFVAGPLVADALGPLAMLVLGLTPAVPGLIATWRLVGRRFFWSALTFGLGAVPQTLLTVVGLAGGDPFLTYRQSSSKHLGVSPVDGVLCAVPVLLPLIFLLLAGLHRRNALWFAFPAGGAAAWFITASNDVWGANQEPYRLWIDMFMMVAAVGLPIVVGAAVDCAGGRATDEPGTRRAAHYRRAPAVVAIAISVALVAVAFPDWLGFRSAATGAGYISFVGPKIGAAVEAAAPADQGAAGLVLPDSCMNAMIFKKAWGGPTATFNYGMAWPDHPVLLRKVNTDLAAGVLDPGKARAAGVGWLLTDSNCSVHLGPATGAGSPTTSVPYSQDGQTGTMQLWRIPG